MSTGTQRQHSRLAKKRVSRDKLYENTPRIYPDTRQIRRQEIFVWCKELTTEGKKAARTRKRNQKKSGDNSPRVTSPVV